MTIDFYDEVFTTTSGEKMFITQYAEKPHFVKLWMYGFVYNGYRKAVSNGLLSKPNKKRLIQKY